MNDEASFEHPDNPPDYLSGQMVLRVRPDAVWPHLADSGATQQAARELPEAVTGPLDYLRRNAGLSDIDPVTVTPPALTGASGGGLAAQRLAIAASVTETDIQALAGFSIARVSARRLTRELVRHVARADAIEVFERVPARWLTASPSSPDPMRNLQWGLRAIDWFYANPPDASGVRVGVIDSGIDSDHPTFAGLKITYDQARKGKLDVVGHGTHVAGTIAALVDDDDGIAGMARPQLAVWKVLPNEPQTGKQFYIEPKPYIAALTAAAEARLDVLNLSLAGSKESESVEPDAICALIDADVNVVAATGNGYLKGDPKMYPACYDGVFAVGSIAEDGTHSSFSGTGPYIDLVAPGSNVLSVLPMRRSKHRPKRRLDVLSGTSMAAAHVSGALALLAAKHPDWTAAERAERLRRTARKLPGMRGREWTREYGFGLLDVHAALS